MKNRFLLILIISALSSMTTFAEWVPVSKSKTDITPPKVTLLSSDEKSTTFRIELSGFDLKQIGSDRKSYQAIDLLTESYTTEPGSPEVPYLAKILAVPDHAGLSAEVIHTGDVLTFSDIHLPPARKSNWEGEPLGALTENPVAYSSKGAFPDNAVLIDPPSIFRDFRIARVSVFPVRYNAAKNEIQVSTSITIRVNYGKGPVINPKNSPIRKIAPSFGKIYRSTILNYQEMLNTFYRGVEDGRELMLVIMPDGFYDSFQGYATWKRQTGTDVHITRFSEIGANANNPVPIKNHITDAYNNWDNPPTYVLMVGDDGKFPKKIVTYPDYSFPWEEYFVAVDGVDFIPDMMVGRFTNETDFTLQVMVNKFKLYEKTPYVTNPNWFKKGVVCSNNAYASQVSTKRFTYNLMMNEGSFTSVDTLMSDGDYWTGEPCTVDLDDVTSAINDGRSYLNYRGEGWSSGWSASCYSFQVPDVTGLTNGQMMPFVTSIGCGVAMFNSGDGNSFGEEWIETGTIANPKGAACFIGPTSNTHTAYNNSIDRGIYVGMFREGMDTPGQAMLRGKLYLYNSWGVNDSWVEYHYKIFCILGDPSIHIWKDLPQLVTCNYPATINVGNNHLEVSVAHLSSGVPVHNAEVCITGAELFATGICNEEGIAVIDFIPETEETLTITIRGGNVIPFQGQITVVRPASLVMPETAVVDDINGNDDNYANPNENCSLTYTLKNWGSTTAVNVQATLSTTYADFVEIITTNPVNFGNIAADETSTGAPFEFYVLPTCPVGQIIVFQLHVTSGTSSWDYAFETEVNGCNLVVKNYVVHDYSASTPNYRLDPGESVAVVLELENIGGDIAPDVTGTLSSDSPFVDILDSFGIFGSMNINDTSVNNINYFKVSLSPTCPVGTIIDFQVLVETGNGNYPYQKILNFSIPVSSLIASDYTGPDAYGYYAYVDDDSFFEQTPVYNWVEISGIGNEINTGGASEYTRTVSLPFGFKYYGLTYNQVRVSTDGWIAFGSGTQTSFNNQTLPNDDNINNMVAVFWDNLFNTDYVNGNILTYYDQLYHRFIIEWDGVTINSTGNSSGWAKFEIILLDPAYYTTITGDGEILFQYFETDNVSSITVGIENSAQDIGLLYAFDNNYNPSASEIIVGRAIKFTTNPPFENIITSVNEAHSGETGYLLGQNQPNPFHSSTLINYSVPESGHVTLDIFDIRGLLVRTLINGQQSAGQHAIRWDGLEDNGSEAGAGIYFYRIQTENISQTRKMIRLK